MGYKIDHELEIISNLVKRNKKPLTAILQQKYTPEFFKTGIRTPCVNNREDNLISNNHRGIIVTSLLSKLLEHTIAEREELVAKMEQNKLRFGFSEGLSPTTASMIVTEVTAEYKDQGLPTYRAALDTAKAFDTVWHSFLFIYL